MARSPLKRLEMDIRDLAIGEIRKGTPVEMIRQMIGLLIRDAALPDALRNQVLAEAGQELAWVAARTLDPTDRGLIVEVMSGPADEFARIGDRIESKVVRAVEFGLRRGLHSGEIENLVARAVRGTAGNAKAIVQAATAAFDRADVFRQATPVSRFRYVGPPAVRTFCEEQLRLARAGKTYTRREIGELRNGQGLSVLYHCGGWGCHHDWEEVIE